MMNSYRHNSGNGRRRLFFAALLVLVIFLIDGASGGNIRAALRVAASSVWGAGERMGNAVLESGLLSTRRALERENQALRNELARLQMRAADYEIMKEENESLRAFVHLAENANGLTAPVVSSFRASPYGTFLIGAGTEDGVQEGNLVLVGDPQLGGFVVGRVEDADGGQSLVKGIFAPGERTEATIQGIGVTVEGRGGGQARADAPRDAEIQPGDPVISANFGVRAIGIVGRVEEGTGNASQRIYIHLPIPLTSLEFVYVLVQ